MIIGVWAKWSLSFVTLIKIIENILFYLQVFDIQGRAHSRIPTFPTPLHYPVYSPIISIVTSVLMEGKN